jgi:hypothetical protein
MSLDLVNDVWTEVKRHLPEADRFEAAESLLDVLIDNNFAPEDIREEFKRDVHLKRALQNYLDDTVEDEDDEEDYEETFDDEDY